MEEDSKEHMASVVEAEASSDPTGSGGGAPSPGSMKNKVCAVCADRALGYNFNALTCESCKAFFRRNALKNKEFKCPFNDSCEVTVVTRRFCQKCRLKKCFDVGMKKEWILSEAEKQQKRQKIEENRAKKRADQGSSRRGSQLDQEEEETSAPSSPLPPLAHAINPSSPFAAETTATAERPQARVLPSTRATPESALGQPPRSKIMRISPGTSSVATNAVIPPMPSSTALLVSSTLGHDSAWDNSNQRVGLAPKSTLIKQELTSETETSSAVSHHQFVPPSPPHNVTAPEPPPQSEGTVMLQPMVTAATAMATAQVQEGHEKGTDGVGAIDLHRDSNGVFGEQQKPDTRSDDSEHQTSQAAGPMSSHQCSSSSLVIPDFSQTSNLDEIVAVAIEAEFHVENLHQEPQNNGPALNVSERNRLHELFVASRALVEPIDCEKNAWNTEPNNLISVINLTDLAIKRIIRMTKKISPFISMCQEDQIALLKGGCTELMILRSVINYNPDKNTWSLPSNDSKEVSMELLKEASQLGVNLYEEHQRFVRSFDPRWRTDENVMLLLSAIALFNPKRPNVTHRDVIKLEQDTYYFLLRRYLETAGDTGCDARRSYLHLIGRLQDLHRLNDSHIQLFLEVNPKLVEPLLIEIFDLKPYANK